MLGRDTLRIPPSQPVLSAFEEWGADFLRSKQLSPNVAQFALVLQFPAPIHTQLGEDVREVELYCTFLNVQERTDLFVRKPTLYQFDDLSLPLGDGLPGGRLVEGVQRCDGASRIRL